SRRRSPAGRGPGTCRPRPRWGSTPWPDGSWRVLAFGSGLEHRFEESTGVRCGHLGDLLGCALGDDLAAAATAFGTEVDDVVGVADDIEVVFDDDDRVALVDEPLEDLQQLRDVLEVQARRRLVEHVDGPSSGALRQFGGELHPLRLTTGQGRGRLSEADVAEPDLDEGLQVAGDRRDRGEEVTGPLDRHIEDLRAVLGLERDLEGLPVVAGPVADLAGHV